MTNRAAIALAALLAAALFGGMFWWQVEGPGGPMANAQPPAAAPAIRQRLMATDNTGV